MVKERATVSEINDFIQDKMKELNVESVNPVVATHWLVEAGLKEKIESRPGCYIRKLCREGKVMGAEQINKLWKINRK